ncbi:MAG: methionine--tRNA ligase [Candidatus Levybacteria bacterium]|nr:methionine--tRNA ligase [Candidatus Levybacteria bacterium]
MDLRVGKVTKCERKEGADKLLRLTVDFGEEGERTILSSLYPDYQPEDFTEKNFVFIVNLEPRKFMGEESAGMILCADSEKPVPLITQSSVPAGKPIV